MMIICLLTTMTITTLTGCEWKQKMFQMNSKKKVTYKDFTYEVNPEMFALSQSNVDWSKLKEQIDSPILVWMEELIQKYSKEPGEFFTSEQFDCKFFEIVIWCLVKIKHESIM